MILLREEARIYKIVVDCSKQPEPLYECAVLVYFVETKAKGEALRFGMPCDLPLDSPTA